MKKEEKLELGEKVHHRPADKPIRVLAEELGLGRTVLYAAVKEYRDHHGLTKKRDKLAAKPKAKPESRALTTSATEEIQYLKEYAAQRDQEIQRMQHEITTLQKIVMVIGEKL